MPSIQDFRRIFYSIIASTVLLILPSTFKANSFGYLLSISLVLFCSIVETFLKLEQGVFAKRDDDDLFFVRLAFFFDVAIVVPAFVFASFFIKDYCEEVLSLAKALKIDSVYLSDMFIDVDHLRYVAISICALFVILLGRGLVDRLLFKVDKGIKKRDWLWITAHASAIGVTLYTIGELDKISNIYVTMINQIRNQIPIDKNPIEFILMNRNLPEIQNALAVTVDPVNRLRLLTNSSVVVLIIYLLFNYVAPIVVRFDWASANNEKK